MTTPATTRRRDSSLARDLLYAAHYYLWRPRLLLALAAIAIIAGLALNWSWLVAAGLVPILISTLPCLLMCAFGVCMMCRSGAKTHASVSDTTEAASSPPTSPAGSAVERPSTAALPVTACCQGAATDNSNPEQTIDLQVNQERRDSHA